MVIAAVVHGVLELQALLMLPAAVVALDTHVRVDVLVPSQTLSTYNELRVSVTFHFLECCALLLSTSTNWYTCRHPYMDSECVWCVITNPVPSPDRFTIAKVKYSYMPKHDPDPIHVIAWYIIKLYALPQLQCM